MKIVDFFRRPPAPQEPYLQYSAKARLYEFESRMFVCSVAWIAETESLTVLDEATSHEELGKVVLKHLAEFDPSERDISSHRARDWAAFRASGAKTINSFERSLWQVDLAVMNSAILVWAAPRFSLNDCELSSYASANRSNPELVGRAIHSALAAAKVLRAQGVV